MDKDRTAQNSGQLRAAKGYTLMEFMAAITIMALLVSLAVPSIQSGFGKQHLRSATLEVMDVFSFARVQAMSRNRAYVVTITGQGTPSPKFVVDESSNTRCAGITTGLKGVRIVDFSKGDFSDMRIVDSAPAGLGNGSFGLCYLPDGRVVQSDTLVPVANADANWGAGEAWISLQSVKEGTTNTTMGLIHRVVVPYNGVPEMRPGGNGAPSV